jgi:UDP-N-acetylglucosamine acyltransferase
MIAGTSEVVKDVPPFVLAGRTPLAFEGLNLVGLRRRNFTPEVIRALDAAYTILYMNDADTALALDRVRSDIRGCSEVDHVVSFVASTRNGIISKHHR